jgi:hypothetical protein
MSGVRQRRPSDGIAEESTNMEADEPFSGLVLVIAIAIAIVVGLILVSVLV